MCFIIESTTFTRSMPTFVTVVNSFTTKEGVGILLWKSGLADQQVN